MQKVIELDDGRKFHDVIFEKSPCDGCGVCCKHFRVSFYQGELMSHPGGLVPNEMVSQVTPFLVCMKGTEQGKGKCIALGQDGRCGIYEQRPTPCREYPLFMDDGSLNPECIRLRQMYGIETFIAKEEPFYSGSLDRCHGTEPDMGTPNEIIYGFDNRHKQR